VSDASQTDPNVDPGSAAGVDASPSAQAGTAADQGNDGAAAAAIATPGQLAAAREARGWTVGDLASKLGMAPRQIEAIERGDWDALPGQAFVRGAIRACGKALQADVEPLIGSVGGAVQAAELRPTAALDAPLPRHGALGFDNGGSGSRLTWILLAILGVIAIAMYFGRGGEWSRVLEGATTGAQTPGRSVETVPLQPSVARDAPSSPGASGESASSGRAAPTTPSPPAGAASPSPAPSPSPASPSVAAVPAAATTPAPTAAATSGAPLQSVTAQAPGAPPAMADGALRFRFEGESWVEVRDAGGKLLLHGIQPAGSERRVAGTRPYSLTVGNAGHVRLEFDGRQVDLGAIARQGVARLKVD